MRGRGCLVGVEAKSKYWRYIFLLSSAFAAGFAISGLAIVNFLPDKILSQVTIEPNLWLFPNLFFFLVLTFAMGYYWISIDPQQNVNIIKLGIIGKLGVALFFILGFLRGEATLFTLLGAIVELVFVWFFIKVLKDISQLQSTTTGQNL